MEDIDGVEAYKASALNQHTYYYIFIELIIFVKGMNSLSITV
jgi:hypothetical protein